MEFAVFCTNPNNYYFVVRVIVLFLFIYGKIKGVI